MPRFEPCPDDSQKCVSTLNDTGYPASEPLPFTCEPTEAMDAVRRVVADYPRTSVEVDDGLYLRTIFKTAILRFKDTVEFEVDPDEQVIHYRSESVPYAGSDLGANRKRMDEVTELLRAELPG